MEDKTNVIKLRYTRDGAPSGREYTFYTPEPVAVGDEVVIDVLGQDKCAHGVVTAVNVPLAEIEKFGGRAKAIVGKVIEKQQEMAVDGAGADDRQLLDI